MCCNSIFQFTFLSRKKNDFNWFYKHRMYFVDMCDLSYYTVDVFWLFLKIIKHLVVSEKLYQFCSIWENLMLHGNSNCWLIKTWLYCLQTQCTWAKMELFIEFNGIKSFSNRPCLCYWIWHHFSLGSLIVCIHTHYVCMYYVSEKSTCLFLPGFVRLF